MQRHSTSYPQAVLFLDTQTQGCISFEQLGSRLKVRWIISAAKLCLAIITGPPHRKWQAKSQNVLGRSHGSDLCNPDSLPSQAQGAPKAEKQNQNNGSAGCISSSSTSTPEPQAGSSQSEQHTGHSSPGLTAKWLWGIPTGDPGQNKSCVLLWWYKILKQI